MPIQRLKQAVHMKPDAGVESTRMMAVLPSETMQNVGTELRAYPCTPNKLESSKGQQIAINAIKEWPQRSRTQSPKPESHFGPFPRRVFRVKG